MVPHVAWELSQTYCKEVHSSQEKIGWKHHLEQISDTTESFLMVALEPLSKSDGSFPVYLRVSGWL